MKKIIFMRHSYASNEIGLSDAQRPLTDRGIELAARAAEMIKAKNIRVDKILTSPKLRALQTAEIVAKAFAVKPRICPDLSGMIHVLEMWEFIKQQVAAQETALVVGHNPDLSHLLNLLTNTSLSLSPSEFAVVNFEDDYTLVRLEPINEETFF